jgi:hypothetical protein
LNYPDLIETNHSLYCTICETSYICKDHIHHSYINYDRLTIFLKENKSNKKISEQSFPIIKQEEEETIVVPENIKMKKNSMFGAYKEYLTIGLLELKKIYENLCSTHRKIESYVEELFRTKMKCHKFNSTNEIFSSKKHYFYKEIQKSLTNATLLKRLENEFKKLDKELPCEFSNSIFVRADKNNPQLIKAIIAGARGTPYVFRMNTLMLHLNVVW